MQNAGLGSNGHSISPVGNLGRWVNARLRKMPRVPLQQLRQFDRLVPVLRIEDRVPLPLGQSVIAIGALDA
jgi:hypothetical protein